ncbi:hypothetical protein [Amphibiibacter pelophylacis]|uniref:Uncharacterized protein n=1 Tax=Amphibiibacter pelophylacis TaxID=1799477 RepID=A0ACC6P3Z7_9BURK
MRKPLFTALALAALLSACGGSVSTVNPFRPTRMVVLGDENSALVKNDDGQGRKYTVNYVDTTSGAVSCDGGNLLWVQAVARYYNDLSGSNTLVFDACRPTTGDTTAPATVDMQAAAGTTTAQVIAQLGALTTAAQAAGATPDKQLVTVLVGQNDIIAAYKTFDGSNQAALVDSMKALGAQMGQAVSSYISAGGKLLMAYPVDIEYSPWALAEAATPAVATSTTGVDRQALIRDLGNAWRTGFYGAAPVNGRGLALVPNGLIDQYANSSNPASSYNLSNIKDAACTDASVGTACTDTTLQSGATALTWMWASSTVPAQRFQVDLGNLALSRLVNNPL